MLTGTPPEFSSFSTGRYGGGGSRIANPAEKGKHGAKPCASPDCFLIRGVQMH